VLGIIVNGFKLGGWTMVSELDKFHFPVAESEEVVLERNSSYYLSIYVLLSVARDYSIFDGVPQTYVMGYVSEEQGADRFVIFPIHNISISTIDYDSHPFEEQIVFLHDAYGNRYYIDEYSIVDLSEQFFKSTNDNILFSNYFGVAKLDCFEGRHIYERKGHPFFSTDYLSVSRYKFEFGEPLIDLVLNIANEKDKVKNRIELYPSKYFHKSYCEVVETKKLYGDRLTALVRNKTPEYITLVACESAVNHKALLEKIEQKSGWFKDRSVAKQVGAANAIDTYLNSSTRYLATAHNLALLDRSLDALAIECPNFESVTTYIKKQIRLRSLGDKLIKFDPILLAGSPGTGKSYFARKLAEALGITMNQINFENEQNSAGLNGSSKHYSNSEPGVVFNAIVLDYLLNTLFFGDELDKVRQSNTTHGITDPAAGLYQLLEPDQAKSFKDQAADVVFDASNINWVFTANELYLIPKPVLNRLRVFHIETPSISQCEKIVNNMIQGIAQSMGIEDKSVFVLDRDAVAGLSAYIFENGLSLRDMKRMVYDFMSDRAKDADCRLTLPEAKQEMRIGF
jgi:hypothetical protein